MIEKLTKAIALISPKAASWVDWQRPDLWVSWGGPMNGQVGRQRVVRQLAASFRPEVVIETGTFRGATTSFLHAVTGAPTYTVEATPRYFEFARRRFAAVPEISVERGDSRTVLRRLAQDAALSSKRAFIYLDAHWEEDLPLAEEIEIIREGWRRSVVMIDDFAVPDDPGYRYDDYGPGKVLNTDYLPTLDGWTLLFPSIRSSDETGARRGCVVLVPDHMAADVAALCDLRSVA